MNTFPNQYRELADNTHFNTYGAYQIAKMVLQGIQNNGLGIREHIIDFKRYDPSRPDKFEDWEWPWSIRNSFVKPAGN